MGSEMCIRDRALIAVGLIVGARALGGSLNDLFGDVDGELAEAFDVSE